VAFAHLDRHALAGAAVGKGGFVGDVVADIDRAAPVEGRRAASGVSTAASLDAPSGRISKAILEWWMWNPLMSCRIVSRKW
jgi:hypothetical protein